MSLAHDLGYEPVIGLEVHAQLRTESKMFSASSTLFGARPNSQTDAVVLALPGCLPVANRQAVELGLRLALASGCRIRRRSRFARKHYFYPDLPKGYQISQYDEPLAEGGAIEFLLGKELRRVHLTRIHLEEDAGKSMHLAARGVSLVDYNRAGVPLLEIVSEPELRSASEAALYMRALRQLVRWLGICDGNMEQGSLRCDANVSLRRRGSQGLGVRTELKNINSFKFVERALEHEIERHAALLGRGDKVTQETRLWDAEAGVSRSMRGKEEAEDYRYLPEPDLPPLVIDDAWVERVRAGLPELPLARQRRLVASHGLAEEDAGLLTSERALADYFEAAVTAHGDARKVASWIQNELLRELRRDDARRDQPIPGGEPAPGGERELGAFPVSPAALAELLHLIDDGVVSGKLAKQVLVKMCAGGGSARAIVAAEGLAQLSDQSAIEAACRAALEGNPRQVEQYRAGRGKLLGFFVGEVMKATRGKANPGMVDQMLRRLLGQIPRGP